MSNLYTLDNTERKSNQGFLYDIIHPVIRPDDTMNIYKHYVTEEEEMRIDMICYNIYGHFNFVDEILTLNNIKNPFSIKQNDLIYYLDSDDVSYIQSKLPTDDQDIVNKLVNPSKDTKKDPNREKGTGLPPTIKPKNLREVDINFDSKTISLINKLQ